jgi:hypothetical protein
MRVKPFLSASQFIVWGFRGDVVSAKTWSETHVHGSSSGGGGFVSNGSGYVSSPSVSVSSTVVTRNSIFLKLPNGTEEKINYSGQFGVRDGHEVSAIFVSFADKKSGYLLRLQNHVTGEIDEYPRSIKNVIPWSWRLRQFAMCFAVFALLLWLLPGTTTIWKAALACALPAGILCWPLLVIERRRVRKAVLVNAKQEAERLAQHRKGSLLEDAAPVTPLVEAHAQ